MRLVHGASDDYVPCTALVNDAYWVEKYLDSMRKGIHSFALVCALFSIGSILVAFITSPLTFNLPAMNSLCAFALPLISLAKSSSDNDSVTIKRICQRLDSSGLHQQRYGQLQMNRKCGIEPIESYRPSFCPPVPCLFQPRLSLLGRCTNSRPALPCSGV